MYSPFSNIKTFLGAYFFTVVTSDQSFLKFSKRLIGRIAATYAAIAPTGRKEKGVMRNAKLTPCKTRSKFGVTVGIEFARRLVRSTGGFRRLLVVSMDMVSSVTASVSCPSDKGQMDYVWRIVFRHRPFGWIVLFLLGFPCKVLLQTYYSIFRTEKFVGLCCRRKIFHILIANGLIKSKGGGGIGFRHRLLLWGWVIS